MKDTLLSFLCVVMSGIVALLVVWIACVLPTEAFQSRPMVPSTRQRIYIKDDATNLFFFRDSSNVISNDGEAQSLLTHQDLQWRIQPLPETPPHQKVFLRLATAVVRLESWIQNKKLPTLLCPAGGQAVLEAFYQGKKVGRFGITTVPGPPASPIMQAVRDIYQINKPLVQTGAIIYMFVEPEYRRRNIGPLALQMIAFVHAHQGMDFTVLVVDDDGSGKLIDWYQRMGYCKAPQLQELLGSPGGQFGITMMAPTNGTLPAPIRWW